jgi:uroporphyrinogen decarboxylase
VASGVSDKSVLRVLRGEPVWPPPIWIMRQAGRYLPEYREVRKEAGSFLDLCYTPAFATEVTLQPIRRYGFDASIIFSDILVVPHALGVATTFVEGEGPRLEPTTGEADLAKLAPELPLERLGPVYEAIGRVRSALPAETTLLGFCGAPWTVACYMIAGRGTPDQAPALRAAREDPVFLGRLIDRLVESSIAHLVRQLEAGADAVQIFESHAGALPPDLFGPLSLEPIRRIADGVRARRPGAPIIVFPRGARPHLPAIAARSGADAIGIDQDGPLDEALALLPADMPAQGNLDPLVLVEGGSSLDQAVDDILRSVRGRPHIFNLGHGIVPPTPTEHVAQMIARIRAA